MLYNEVCQHLEDVKNSVNHYFPNDQRMMLQSRMVTDHSNSKKANGIYVTVRKFIIWYGFTFHRATGL